MVPHYLLSIAFVSCLPLRGNLSHKTFSKICLITTETARAAANKTTPIEHPLKAADRTRTDDLVLTKDVLYQLSYSSRYCRPRLPLAVKMFSCHAFVATLFPEEKTLRDIFLRGIQTQLFRLPFFLRRVTDRDLFRFLLPKFCCLSFSVKLCILPERVKGIEPSSSAWKAVALPLSYTRK